jgi:aminocarboxymuconate-semialdehyde decarboxylase
LVEEAHKSGGRYGLSLDESAQPLGRLVFDNGTILRPFFQELCDLEVRIPLMDKLGVDVQVVSTWTDIAGYHLPVDQGTAWARLQNDTIAESVSFHPDRFEAMGTLPMQDVEASIAELDYLVDELRLRAVEVGTSVNGTHVATEAYLPLWRALAEREVFVLLHPPLDPIGASQLQEHFLKNLLGNPMDTTIAAAKMIVSGLLDEIPGLKICLVHGGGFLPYQIGRLDQGHAVHPDTRRLIADHVPSSYLDRFYYDTIIYDRDALSFLAERVSTERILLGSDYPFEMFDSNGIARIYECGFSDDQVDAILGANAVGVLQRKNSDRLIGRRHE